MIDSKLFLEIAASNPALETDRKTGQDRIVAKLGEFALALTLVLRPHG